MTSSTVCHIPLEAYEYVVNSKPALEWVMERRSVSKNNVNVTVTTMGLSLERGAWGSRNVPRYGQPTYDFETGCTRSCAKHG